MSKDQFTSVRKPTDDNACDERDEITVVDLSHT